MATEKQWTPGEPVTVSQAEIDAYNEHLAAKRSVQMEGFRSADLESVLVPQAVRYVEEYLPVNLVVMFELVHETRPEDMGEFIRLLKEAC